MLKFFYQVTYVTNTDSAIINASKAACLSVLIANGITTASHFDPQNIEPLRDAIINEPMPTKLNKLKKSNIEAFFYWNEICILKNKHSVSHVFQ